ncbi:hypothetical protein Tco_0569664 [Tanacetum coccineum]
MGDANPICTLGDYSKPSHEGYRNTIELPVGNNVVPLRSDTIRLVQNGCSFHGLRSEDPNQHLKDFLKLVDSLDLDCENKERMRMSHLALMQPTQMNKITSSCEICGGPHDTWYCMENPEQAFVDYASSRTDGTRSSYQTKLDKALIDFKSHQEKRLSSLRTQLRQQQDDMISKINLLWKAISKKLDDTPIRYTAGNPAAQMNFTSTNDPTREELQGKRIKSPSKLLSPKYLSQSSLAEQNRNPSSLKRVYFVNSIVILNKEDEAKEEGNVKTSTTEYEDHEMTVESEEEFEEETEDEIEEEEEDSPKHFDTFLTMKELRYLALEKPSTPMGKGQVKGLKVFVVNFTYECEFMVLEDTTSVIDHDLGLYLIRRSLEVLRKFHWMILGGQFN